MNATPHFIGGRWIAGTGPRWTAINPSTGATHWEAAAAAETEVEAAVVAARAAFPEWSRRTQAERETVVRAFALLVEEEKTEFAAVIARETGKPIWDATSEAVAMVNKVPIAIEAHARRCAEFTGGPAVTRFRAHGVVAVLGPFNFPGHLPNGHIVPALVAGNTVVFKPSELTPLTAQRTVELWEKAGAPPGVINLVQGGLETGAAVAMHPGIDGLFFTGSARTGLALSILFAKTPGRILALEMGGNNPLVVHRAADHATSALLTIQSAYLGAGQRCTCARRLIVPVGAEGDAFIATLVAAIPRIRLGAPEVQPEPFMGPVIRPSAADALVSAQENLVSRGGVALVPMRRLAPETGFITPGLIDVTAVENREDEELFGPLLQLIRVPDFDAAIREANNTHFGLAAGLISDDRALYEKFFTSVRAGIINWNQQLTGASSAAAFGGLGASGNNRPAAFLSADYCSHAVASIESAAAKPAPQPGLDPP
ncbi:MAG TPA: succinylglutamate-semialdehyde dehydrogenase [Opitutaceae bacterium]|nr:succinylglutamate-semialdehyde dehydrogenase [Opitutaceae bacterium]